MTLRVMLFGPQAQLAGRRHLDVDLRGDSITCRALLRRLARVSPALAPSLRSSRLAVNHEFARDDRRVLSSDDVALIGMVSGG